MASTATATLASIRAARVVAWRQAATICAIILAALALLALVTLTPHDTAGRPTTTHTWLGNTVSPATPTEPLLVEPQIYKPLTVIDAVAENQGRPLDNRPLQVSMPFLLPINAAGEAAWDKALNCLALANYYEAASEGTAGMRAVSQVVLNRMRHPAFPHSVCEVVFQGSERQTGCQFTFTCDGSLRRPPIPTLFSRAKAVATEALRGRVEAGVGMATHYHANTVVPYWADSLDKIRTLGAHIFYVWRGENGNRATFRATYTGEPEDLALPTLTPMAVVDGNSMPPVTLSLASGLDQINLTHNAAKNKALNRSYLVADESSRSLRADEDQSAGTLRVQPALAYPSEKVLSDDR